MWISIKAPQGSSKPSPFFFFSFKIKNSHFSPRYRQKRMRCHGPASTDCSIKSLAPKVIHVPEIDT